MEPAVKPALSHAAGKRVLILATELTLKLEKLSSLVERLDTQNQVDCLPLQALVGMAERMELSAERVIPYLEDQFSSINWSSYGSVVLGCTHFPFFEAHLKRLLPPHISIFDGIRGTVAHLRNQLTPQPATDLPGRVAYYESGRLIPPEKMEAYFTYL
jgi:glutamate racemase